MSRLQTFKELLDAVRHPVVGEGQIARNRIAAGTFSTLYLAASGELHGYGLVLAICYMTAAVCFALAVAASPREDTVRKCFGLVLDIGGPSCCMLILGAGGAFFFPTYFWTILGYGFRFGSRFMYAGTIIAMAGFGMVLHLNVDFHDNLRMTVALLCGLPIIPFYASSLVRNLHKAKAEAEAASLGKSRFMASVSHELRTPLNAIIGMSDLLAETRLDAKQADMNGTVATAGRSLLAHINTILDYSRLEVGRMPAEKAPFALAKTVADAAAMVTVQARSKGLDLRVETASDLPEAVMGGRRHVEEVLVNLAANAVKFTSVGSVTINASRAAGNLIRFEVADTGIGIAPEAQERIFEAFSQADETILDSFGGTGLGLAICRQLVELHGGTIGVDSKAGAGSRFWFELPLDPCDLPVDVEQAAPPAEIGRSLRILVADDMRSNRMVAERLLENSGHVVVLVEDGRQALEALTDDAFDVALIDLNMPVMTGVECARLYAFACGGKPAVPLIALTADVTEKAQAVVRNAGMAGFVAKPIDRAVLFAAIASVIDGVALPVAEEGPAPEDVPVLDERKLEELVDLGGREFLAEMVGFFGEDAPPLMDAIDAALAAGDGVRLREAVHALLSSCSNAGADRMYRICRRVHDHRDPIAAAGEDFGRIVRTEFSVALDAARARSELPLAA